MSTSTSTAAEYVLGHADDEMERLALQARYLGDLSRSMLLRAGLRPGMRVLDVGSGAGDVALLAAQMVGPSGSVVGIDRAPASVELAGRRATHAGLGNVQFVEADVDAYAAAAGSFDAVIGRFVLMYLPDPAATLRRLADLVRPGGIVTFQEYIITIMEAEPATPLISTALQRVSDTFDRAGAETRMGLRLPAVFREGGLPAPETTMAGRVEHGPGNAGIGQLVGITRTLAPTMVATGVATLEEIGLDTLPARLAAEAAEFYVTVMTPPLVAAWSQLPS